MDDTTKALAKTIIASQARTYAAMVAGALVGRHILPAADQGQFVDLISGMVVGAATAGWSWWNASGRAQLHARLQKMTGTKTPEAAAKVADAAPSTPPPSVTAIAAKVGAVVLLAIMLLPAVASAQDRNQGQRIQLPIPFPKPGGGQGQGSNEGQGTPSAGGDRAQNLLDKPFQDLAAFIGDDIDAAITLSTSIPSLQDGNGQQCLMGLKTFGEVIKAHPAPLTFKIATDLEAFRLKQMAVNQLCENTACTVVFADITQTITALSPMPLPIPSLHDLCSKVPTIKVVAPVTPATPAATKQ